jgi:hypothetical protein
MIPGVDDIGDRLEWSGIDVQVFRFLNQSVGVKHEPMNNWFPFAVVPRVVLATDAWGFSPSLKSAKCIAGGCLPLPDDRPNKMCVQHDI